MVNFRSLALLLTLLWVGGAAWAQTSPLGTWKTIDDKTGEAKSHIEVYEKNGKLHGRVVKLLRKPADTVCEKCTGDKQNKPLVGMVVVTGMAQQGTVWKGGSILDPESGSEYSCSFWFEGADKDELFVRGKHWTGIYRTQKWYRVK